MKPVIGVIGAGYVGLVVATCYAKMGYKVVLYEKDKGKADCLLGGTVPFFEPYLQDLYLKVFNNNLFLALSLEQFFEGTDAVDIVFSCVPTPASPDGSADITFVSEVCGKITELLSKDLILICKSTLPPGCSAKIAGELPSKVTFVYSPEFLRQGQAITDFLVPDRIVFGIYEEGEGCVEVKQKLLDLTCDLVNANKVLFTDFITAELIKHASNAMLASRITFMNQVLRFAKTLGADMKKVALGIGMDHRIGPDYLEAGPGFGGSCLPKDLSALIIAGEACGIDVSFLKSIAQFNASQLDWFYSFWKNSVGDLKGHVVAVKGVSFKACTSDLRNSVQIELVKKILAEEPADILLLDKTLSDQELLKIRFGLGLLETKENDPDQEKTVLLFRNL